MESPPGGSGATGAAFPFRDGVEVLWASVDGDPNRPVILGALPNPSTLSPVTSRNFGDNIIRTGGRNELLMHDIKGAEHIELKQGDYDRPFNLMRLDANSAGHSIKFACTLGAMEIYAKQTMKVEAGDSITQTHGNDRTETIENTHTLTTYTTFPEGLYLDGKDRVMLRSFRPQKNPALSEGQYYPFTTR